MRRNGEEERGAGLQSVDVTYLANPVLHVIRIQTVISPHVLTYSCARRIAIAYQYGTKSRRRTEKALASNAARTREPNARGCWIVTISLWLVHAHTH